MNSMPGTFEYGEVAPGPDWVFDGEGPRGGKRWVYKGQSQQQEKTLNRPKRQPPSPELVKQALVAGFDDDPSSYLDEELLEFLEDQGVVSAAIPAETPQVKAKTPRQITDPAEQVDIKHRKLPGEKFEPVDFRTTSADKNVNAPSPHLPEESRPKLTQEESQALRDYSMHLGADINAALYGQQEWTPELKKTNDDINRSFDKAKDFSSPKKVYRSLSDEDGSLLSKFEQAKSKRKSFAVKGHQSTSTDRGVAEKWGGIILIEIEAVNGLDMKPYSISPQQWEMLIRDGSEFYVSGIRKSNGESVVALKQLPRRNQVALSLSYTEFVRRALRYTDDVAEAMIAADLAMTNPSEGVVGETGRQNRLPLSNGFTSPTLPPGEFATTDESTFEEAFGTEPPDVGWIYAGAMRWVRGRPRKKKDPEGE